MFVLLLGILQTGAVAATPPIQAPQQPTRKEDVLKKAMASALIPLPLIGGISLYNHGNTMTLDALIKESEALKKSGNLTTPKSALLDPSQKDGASFSKKVNKFYKNIAPQQQAEVSSENANKTFLALSEDARALPKKISQAQEMMSSFQNDLVQERVLRSMITERKEDTFLDTMKVEAEKRIADPQRQKEGEISGPEMLSRYHVLLENHNKESASLEKELEEVLKKIDLQRENMVLTQKNLGALLSRQDSIFNEQIEALLRKTRYEYRLKQIKKGQEGIVNKAKKAITHLFTNNKETAEKIQKHLVQHV